MSKNCGKRRRSTHRPDVLQKPHGVISPRVMKVGPEHFGIVCVDCAKARSKWMLADFYGKVLIPPTTVEHRLADLAATIQQVRQAQQSFALDDMLVSVERTGRYHLPIRRAFLQAGYDTRIIHPFTVKQFRLPADPGVKTDDNDLAANHRATISGFALQEALRDPSWEHWQLLVRHRRDWVQKASTLCCQIKDHLQTAMPGYAEAFSTFWANAAARKMAFHFGSAPALLEAGSLGLGQFLRQQHLRFQQRTIDSALTWAANAPPPDAAAPWHLRIAEAMEEDRASKALQILDLERQIAAALAGTPYVLLLSIPGINVVTASDFGAEAGPIRNYASPRCLTGRAGLYPSRYQSDQVDLPNGPMVKCANRRLRYAIMQAADCLVQCNRHFRDRASQWRNQQADPRLIRVRVGCRFTRIAFHMAAGRQVFRHPCVRDRNYILDKLLAFHMEHQTPWPQIQADLQAAGQWLKPNDRTDEAVPLQQQLQGLQPRRGAQPLAQILNVVLAQLGTHVIQSEPSGI